MPRQARKWLFQGSDPLTGLVAAVPVLLAMSVSALGQNSPTAQRYEPEIPRTWSDEAMEEFELPLAHAEFSPEQAPEDYYYRLPVREVWKSYAIYHPDHEPPGYREQLADLEPEVVFDPTKLITEQDWIVAGAEVFHAPTEFDGPLIRPSV